jgi:hypothetical protein
VFPVTAVVAARVRVGSSRIDSLQRLPGHRSQPLDSTGPIMRVDRRGDAIVAWDADGSSSSNLDGKIEVPRAAVGRGLKVERVLHTDQSDQRVGVAIGRAGEAIVAWNNDGLPNQAVVAPGANAPLGPSQAISSRRRRSAEPAVAIDTRGDAIAVWWDLGARDHNGAGPAQTPLFYTVTKLRQQADQARRTRTGTSALPRQRVDSRRATAIFAASR